MDDQLIQKLKELLSKDSIKELKRALEDTSNLDDLNRALDNSKDIDYLNDALGLPRQPRTNVRGPLVKIETDIRGKCCDGVLIGYFVDSDKYHIKICDKKGRVYSISRSSFTKVELTNSGPICADPN